MSLSSSIEWTESTWNPVTGCTKISPACKNCYAERLAKRLQAMGNPSYSNGFSLTIHPRLLEQPLCWKKPHNIFVNSMSDLFHEELPEEFIFSVFRTMNKAHWHNFQILTKRSERLESLNRYLNWTPNIWMGVSVENEDYLFRMDNLRHIDSSIKFISMEPLLGPFPGLNLEGIDWVIVGGESGPGARPIDKTWVIDIRDRCLNNDTPFFFKQWGGFNRKKNGRNLDGRTWNEMPSIKKFSLNRALSYI